MTHTIFRMTGGKKSYHEVAKLLPEKLANLVQTIVFVDDYRTGHAIAAAVRKTYSLSGKDARDLVPVYHSLKDERSKRLIEKRFQDGTSKILISTKALTIGANFPNIEKVINYLVPRSQPIWIQHAGRSGRRKGAWAEVVIMATPSMLKDAALMCKDAGIVVSAELLNIKIEDDAESDAGEGPVAATHEETSIAALKGPKGRYPMTIGMAEYLVTERCLVEEKRRNSKKQALLAAGQAPKSEPIELEIQQYNVTVEEAKTQAQETAKQNQHSAKEFQVYKKAIEDWRISCCFREADEIDITLDTLMTDKELKRVARFKVTSVESFSDLQVQWESSLEWQTELLEVIKSVDSSEKFKEEETLRTQEEKGRKKERVDKAKGKTFQKKTEEQKQGTREKFHKRQLSAEQKDSEEALKRQRMSAAAKVNGDGSIFHPAAQYV